MKPTAGSSLTSKARPKSNSHRTPASVVVYGSTPTIITRSMPGRYGHGGGSLYKLQITFANCAGVSSAEKWPLFSKMTYRSGDREFLFPSRSWDCDQSFSPYVSVIDASIFLCKARAASQQRQGSSARMNSSTLCRRNRSSKRDPKGQLMFPGFVAARSLPSTLLRLSQSWSSSNRTLHHVSGYMRPRGRRRILL